ncbi:MAG TPA: protein kinase [Bdellovibrionota bacterium]|nr:protein kinase [Bdellovibrionota bacterium]
MEKLPSFLEPIVRLGEGLASLIPILPAIPYRSLLMVAAAVSCTGGAISSLWILLTGQGPPNPADRVRRGDELARKAQYASALEVFVSVNQYARASQMALKLGRTDEAISLALEGKDFLAAGKLLASLQCWQDAAQAFDQANRPVEAGEHWERAGRLDLAAERYQKSGNLRKLESALTRLGKHQEVAELYAAEYEKLSSLLGANPQPKQVEQARTVALHAAEAYVRSKDYKKASDIYIRSGQTLKAAQCLEQVGDLVRASDLYQQAGKQEDAARMLIRAGRYELAADIYDEMGRSEEIPKLLELAGKPKEGRAFAARLALERNDTKEAAELFAMAGEVREAAPLLEQLGEYNRAAPLYAEGNLHAEAAVCFEKAGMSEPAAVQFELAHNYFDAGRMAEMTGQIDRAISFFQRVSKDAPEYSRAAHALGRLFARRGAHQLAIAKLREICKDMEPDRERIGAYYDFAIAMEAAGDFRQAAILYDKILSIDFHYQDVLARKKNLERLNERPRPEPTKVSLTDVATGTQAHETISGASPTAVFHPRQGAIFSERYELERQIGSGAMGVVWLGKDRKLGRPVAIKFPPPYQYARNEDEEMFFREARLAARLAHPHIVGIYDVGKYLNMLFLVMEYVDGVNLRQLLDRGTVLAVPVVCKIGIQVTDALAYAHGHQIVHRDIKSANLLLTKDQVVKVGDFGLARVLEGVEMASTRAVGSPLYMAPEQIQGGTFDHRIDLYALGIVLYELLVGKPPFTEGEVAYHHLHTPPKPLDQLRQGIPGELQGIVSKLLEKNPATRYGTAAEVQVALELLSL